MPPYIATTVSVLSGIVSVIAILRAIREVKEQKQVHDELIRRQERERAKNDARLESIEEKLDNLASITQEQGRRIDSHNGYAKMFAKNTEANAQMREDLAYIKGKIEHIKP